MYQSVFLLAIAVGGYSVPKIDQFAMGLEVGRFAVTGGSLLGVLSFSSNANWAFCFSRSHVSGIQPCTNVACMRRILGVLPFPPRADWAFCPFRCTIMGRSAVPVQLRIGRFAVPYNRRQNLEACFSEFFLNPRA